MMNLRWSPLLLFACLCQGPGLLSAQETVGDTVMARVDGIPVLESEANRELARFLERLESYSPDQAEAMSRQAKKQVLQDLIGKLILVSVAQASGLTVSQTEIETRLKVVMQSIAPGGSPESFLQEAGISKAQLTEDVRRNLLIQKLVDLKTKDVAPPTDEQVAAFYEDNKARFFLEETVECRHIFFETEGLTDPAKIDVKRSQAEALRAMLLENPKLDFAQISREKSDGPTAENGGYLGFIRKADFLPEFTSVAFAQEVGKVGKVVQTSMGFHLIKVESRAPARQQELAEIRDQVRDAMLQRRRGEVMRQHVDQWRRAAKIELLVPLEGEGEGTEKSQAP